MDSQRNPCGTCVPAVPRCAPSLFVLSALCKTCFGPAELTGASRESIFLICSSETTLVACVQGPKGEHSIVFAGERDLENSWKPFRICTFLSELCVDVEERVNAANCLCDLL